jgi:hypothetical protein
VVTTQHHPGLLDTAEEHHYFGQEDETNWMLREVIGIKLHPDSMNTKDGFSPSPARQRINSVSWAVKRADYVCSILPYPLIF